MGEKYQIKIREYEHKTTQMCTEKYLDYPIRTRIRIKYMSQEMPILRAFLALSMSVDNQMTILF